MRIIILAFMGFLLSGTLLLPRFFDQLAFNDQFYFYGPISLMVLAVLLQIEGIIVLKKILQARKISLENDALSVELKDTVEKLHLEKKKLTEYKSKLNLAEKESRRLHKKLKSSELLLVEEKTKYQQAFVDSEKQFEQEKSQMLSKLDKSDTGKQKLLQLISLLQEKGRFLDFVMDDVSAYSNEQIGAAARIVHGGCVQVLQEYFAITPLSTEQEGAKIQLADDYDMKRHRLLGQVGEPPYDGTLIHRGWKTEKIDLPEILKEGDALDWEQASIIAPVEIELN